MSSIFDIQIIGKTVKFNLASNAIALSDVNGVEVGIPRDYMDMIEKWCFAERCGIRVGLNCFRMDTDEQLSYFLMRWS